MHHPSNHQESPWSESQGNANKEPKKVKLKRSDSSSSSSDDEHYAKGPGSQRASSGYPQPHLGIPVNGFPPYSGYSYPPSTNAYTFNTAAPRQYNPYYGQPYSNNQQQPDQKFPRRFLEGVIACFVLLSFISLFSWVLLRPVLPTFTITSLAVNNLNTSDSHVTGDWEASLMIKNPNVRLDVWFQGINAVLVRNDTNLSNITSASFSVETNVEKTEVLHSKIIGSELRPMMESHESGKQDFSLRMKIYMVFHYSFWWRRSTKLRAFCENIHVDFQGGVGKSTKDKPSKCMLVFS